MYQVSAATRTFSSVDQPERSFTLNVQFVKVLAKKFESPTSADGLVSASILADRRSASRTLIPFTTTCMDGRLVSGLFLTGDRPRWFLKSDKSELVSLACDYSVVYSFSPCSMWDGPANFLMNTEEVSHLL